jgi:ribonuclease HI
MADTRKYYVVWRGKKTGIFNNWAECEAQVKNFPDALFKSFKTYAEAQDALKNPPEHIPNSVELKAKTTEKTTTLWKKNAIAVDAACSGNPGVMEYQGIYLRTQERIFHQKFDLGTNNIGEFLAIVHALAYCKNHEFTLPIYSDSKIAISWVKQQNAKTKLIQNQETQALLDTVHRGELWLKNNTYTNPILKWETTQWGENPADFGRK